MKRIIVSIVLVALTLAAVEAQDPARLFKQAINTEEVEGDLKGAIALYQKVVDSSDRTLAAQALLHMAECYQKLGDAQARSTYERIVQQFADQSEAVTLARNRLEGARSDSGARGDRVVWSGEAVDLFGTVSPDGRYLSYTDWDRTGNLMVHDFLTGADRPLTNNVRYGEFGEAQWSAISRTGDEVAFEWNTEETDRTELRIVSLRDAGGVPQSRLVMQLHIDAEIHPFDWSPDGSWIAALLQREDRTSQFALVNVKDGRLRVLKSVAWNAAGNMVFSPDGRYLAYEVWDEATRESRAYVMPVDASGETIVASGSSRNEVMGWAQDGQLLLASNRAGALGLWAVPIAGGKAAAPPRQVRSTLVNSASLGVARTGTLYVWNGSSGLYVRVVPLDPEAPVAVGQSSMFEHFIDSRGRPDWSGNGKHLLFVSCGPGGGGRCTMKVWSMDTGVVHEVPHALDYVGFPRLSPDGSQIAAPGTDRRGREGVWLVDVTTGATSLVETSAFFDWASDGRGLLRRGPNGSIIRYDLLSHTEREVFSISRPGARGCVLSPDGQLGACNLSNPDGQTWSLVVKGPTGSLQTVLRETGENARFQWMPDSRALFVQTFSSGSNERTLWLAPIDGEPRRLNVGKVNWADANIRLHPDGRHLAFVASAGTAVPEIWALENILPGAR